jgi:hypothetical protein
MIIRLWEYCDLTNVQCTYALFWGGREGHGFDLQSHSLLEPHN